MELVQYELVGRCANIYLNRAEKRNAFDAQLVDELKGAFAQAATDEQAKVIRLMGRGKAFSAGADLGYVQSMQGFSFEENLADSSSLAELYELIYTHPKIVVAQIEGHAIAGGCGLATVCDFSFSVPSAMFGYTETRIGFIPAIVMIFLLRKIGEGRAKELLFTGKLIGAEEAQRFGLINAVVPSESIAAHVDQFIDELCRQTSGESLRRTKQMIAQVQELPLREALQYAARSNAEARMTADCQQGIAQFLAKKAIEW